MDFKNFINIGGFEFSGVSAVIVMLVAVWDLVWKGLGMWRAAQKRQNGWFIAIFLLNTVGILPILYLYVFSKKEPATPTV